MGVLAYYLLHMMRQFYVWGEEVRRSMDWLIKRLIIRRGQNFLSGPEVVCPCGLGFSSIATLSGAAGLGSLSSTAARCFGTAVRYA